MAKAKVATAKDIELNRWCIEQAMRWPIVSGGGYGQGGAHSHMPRTDSDADVIGRASKIMAWIKMVQP